MRSDWGKGCVSRAPAEFPMMSLWRAELHLFVFFSIKTRSINFWTGTFRSRHSWRLMKIVPLLVITPDPLCFLERKLKAVPSIYPDNCCHILQQRDICFSFFTNHCWKKHCGSTRWQIPVFPQSHQSREKVLYIHFNGQCLLLFLDLFSSPTHVWPICLVPQIPVWLLKSGPFHTGRRKIVQRLLDSLLGKHVSVARCEQSSFAPKLRRVCLSGADSGGCPPHQWRWPFLSH